MAVKYGISCLIQLLIIKNVCLASIENIELNYTQPVAAFDELYTDAVEHYTNESWTEAIKYFNLALADYRHESEVRANCLLRCREKTDKSDIMNNGLYDGGSLMLYYAIRVKRCCDLCQETFLGRRSAVAQFIRNAFEKKEPYDYLQFSYFKIKRYQDAASAAFTYLERHPEDPVMLANLKMYTEKFRANKTALKSMELGPHIGLFIQGDKEYQTRQFKQCVHTFEDSLEEYYKAHSKCQALCEYEHRKHQTSFSVALFSHQSATVKCRLACADKLATFNGMRREKFLEDHYHYLQFCYFEIGRVREAAICAKTYLLFHPSDPVMTYNMKFYSRKVRTEVRDIPTRDRAAKYLRQRKLDINLYKVAKYYANPDMMFPGEMPELEVLEENSATVVSSDDRVRHKLRSRSKEAHQFDKDRLEEETYQKSDRWMKNPLLEGVKLFKEGKDLNGSNRVAVDNMTSADDCLSLISLIQGLTISCVTRDLDWLPQDLLMLIQEQGVKVERQGMRNVYGCWNKGKNHSYINRSSTSCPTKEKLSKFGDGFKHNHEDPVHPFTEKETFEGVSIGDAVKAAADGDISIEEGELYANVSEKMRLFVMDYFNLTKPLYVAFTHLVCRTASADANDGVEHLSHPVHSDNCILHADGPGTCPKIHPAYTWRDFSGVLYLNDNFEGGDFIFADPEIKTQASLRPKCGRMVAFSGGISNLHGVRGVKSGRRCALPLWFTFQKNKIEDSRNKYIEILQNLKKQKNEAVRQQNRSAKNSPELISKMRTEF
eukprot:gene16782-18477_t